MAQGRQGAQSMEETVKRQAQDTPRPLASSPDFGVPMDEGQKSTTDVPYSRYVGQQQDGGNYQRVDYGSPCANEYTRSLPLKHPARQYGSYPTEHTGWYMDLTQTVGQRPVYATHNHYDKKAKLYGDGGPLNYKGAVTGCRQPYWNHNCI